MNPFILAGLVFLGIGFVQEAIASKDPKASKVVKPEPKAITDKPKGGDTIVNVGGQTVKPKADKVVKEPAKPAKEPAASDG